MAEQLIRNEQVTGSNPVIGSKIEGELIVKDVAKVLGLSTRQVQRIKKGVKLNGPAATVHVNRKRKPVNGRPDAVLITAILFMAATGRF